MPPLTAPPHAPSRKKRLTERPRARRGMCEEYLASSAVAMPQGGWARAATDVAGAPQGPAVRRA
jgi:hypothetical protein